MDEDYMKLYREFWARLVEDENGNLDLDKVARELFDFHTAIENVGSVYEDITGGMLSKINYPARTVLSEHDSYLERYVYPDVRHDAWVECVDILGQNDLLDGPQTTLALELMPEGEYSK